MGAHYVPLFWRLLIPNATILAVACVVLMVEPANGRVVVLVGGLVVMLTVSVVLMHRAFAPLVQLTALMHDVDPLRPGQRLPRPRQDSEVTLLADAFNGMLDRLESERRESGRRALAEREDERRRLAAELHDEIGQTLTALAFELDRLAQRVPDDLRGDAADVRDAVLATVDDVRGVVRRLRPEALDALGLVPALTSLADRLSERTGMRITRRLDRDLPRLSPEAELVVYRVAQESLTNVVRHAGAGEAEVSLSGDAHGVVLSVRDDGVGLRGDEPERSGMRGMRERALLVGAELSVGPCRDGCGTEVRLEVLPAP